MASTLRETSASAAWPPPVEDHEVMLRSGGRRWLRSVVAFVAGCELVLALGGCAGTSRTAASAPARPSHGSAYTLMDMNLCLSGIAGCYPKVHYPAVVQEAIAR